MDHTQNSGNLDFGQIFNEIKTIAVIGYSDNPERPGHYVAHYLSEQGFEVLAINPRFGTEVNGLKCYPKLSSIPAGMRIDVVDVFRAPEFVPQLVEEAAQLNPLPKYFWMQPGAESEDAASRCRELGIIPVMQACMLAVHKHLQH